MNPQLMLYLFTVKERIYDFASHVEVTHAIAGSATTLGVRVSRPLDDRTPTTGKARKAGY